MPTRNLLPELDALQTILEGFEGARTGVLAQVELHGKSLPIQWVELGATDPAAPTLCFVGGVHGLERIGSQILLAHLESLKVAVTWDMTLSRILDEVRVLFVPILNPGGIAMGYRSNANGVDLMRNAPVSAEDAAPWYMLHMGQRITSMLPWYRGPKAGPMEVESAALCQVIEEKVFPSACGLVIDVHSGFAGQDRLWFPYARTQRLFPGAPEVLALKQLLRQTHTHHRYLVEPQSVNYTTHGDLWDFLYDEHRAQNQPGLFLPLTLELSSASWYRKNPTQLFTRLGFFHPVKPHRIKRVLRRHQALFDFFLRAVYSRQHWLPRDEEHRSALWREAQRLWGAGQAG